jgi:hypothetical protein
MSIQEDILREKNEAFGNVFASLFSPLAPKVDT